MPRASYTGTSTRETSCSMPINLGFSLVDWDSASFHTPLEPNSMVREFLAPFLDIEIERSQFISFLAGYVRNAFIYVEPKRAGFVDELMWMIGGRVTRWPRPRPPPLSRPSRLREISVSVLPSKTVVCVSTEMRRTS